MLSGYLELLAGKNGFGPGSWHIREGMPFGALDKWWGQKGPRGAAHNGLDLREFRASGGALLTLGPGSLVVAAADGKIISVIRDFIAYSVFIDHGEVEGDARGRRLISAYGHIGPSEGLLEGNELRRGQVMGNVSNVPEGITALPHLHLSLFLSSAIKDINWASLGLAEGLDFLDPLKEMG